MKQNKEPQPRSRTTTTRTIRNSTNPNQQQQQQQESEEQSSTYQPGAWFFRLQDELLLTIHPKQTRHGQSMTNDLTDKNTRNNKDASPQSLPVEHPLLSLHHRFAQMLIANKLKDNRQGDSLDDNVSKSGDKEEQNQQINGRSLLAKLKNWLFFREDHGSFKKRSINRSARGTKQASSRSISNTTESEESFSFVQWCFQILQRFNPMINMLEALIYALDSLGMHSLAHLVVELRKVLLVLFRLIWDMFFLFDESGRRRALLEKPMRSEQMRDSSQHYPHQYRHGYRSPTIGNDYYSSGDSYDYRNYDGRSSPYGESYGI